MIVHHVKLAINKCNMTKKCSSNIFERLKAIRLKFLSVKTIIILMPKDVSFK